MTPLWLKKNNSTIISLRFTFQKSGWYRQNPNAILVFVFIMLFKAKFLCFSKYRFPPKLETCLLYYFCEVFYSQSSVNNGFNRLHTPLMPADVFSSEDMPTLLRIFNFFIVKMEICSKFDIAHYFTYSDLFNTTGII